MLAGLPKVTSNLTAVARFCFVLAVKKQGSHVGCKRMMYKKIIKSLFMWATILVLLLAGVLPGQCAMRGDWTPDGVPVTTESIDEWDPVLVPTSDGGTFVAWYTDNTYPHPPVDRRVYLARFDANGERMWVTELSTTTGNMYPHIISDGDDGVFATWYYRLGSALQVVRVNGNGTVLWRTVVHEGYHRHYFPKLCRDDSGAIYIGWCYGGDVERYYIQRISPDGQLLWPGEVQLSSIQNQQYEPMYLVPAGPTTIIAVFSSYYGGDTKDIYAQKIDQDGNILWGTDGAIVCNANKDQEFRSVTPDGEGGVVVVWRDYRNSPPANIYGQRLDSNGNRCWGTQGFLICPTAEQVDPLVVRSGEDKFVVCWWDFRYGGHDIFAQMLDISGAVQWADDGVRITTITVIWSRPGLTSDGFGGAIVTWADTRTGGFCIYAQRLSSAGESVWGVGGECVCSYPGCGPKTAIVLSRPGVAIVAWNDVRNPPEGNRDIYMQRIRSTDGDHFVVTGIADPQVAGTISDVTVEAVDASGDRILNYQGTINFTSNDPKAILPVDYAFVTDDGGIHTFSSAVILKSAGERYVRATDLADSSISGEMSAITVMPAPVDHLGFACAPPTVTAGEVSTYFLVSRYDQYGNAVSSGTTLVNLQSNSTGPQASFRFPPWVAISSVTISPGQSQAKFYYYDEKSGNWTITASAQGLSPDVSHDITIQPSAISGTYFTTAAQTLVAGATSHILCVEVRDSYGNPSPVSSDTALRLTSTSPQGNFSVDGIAWDISEVTIPISQFNATFYYSDTLAGTHTIACSEYPSSGWDDAIQTVTIYPADIAKLEFVTAPQVLLAGEESSPISIETQDEYGNAAVVDATTTLNLITSSPAGHFSIMPAPGWSDVNSVPISSGTYQVKFYYQDFRTGEHELRCSGPVEYGWDDAVQNIVIKSSTVHHLAIVGIPESPVAGIALDITIRAEDVHDNISSDYLGTIQFSSNDSQASLPATYKFTVSDSGVHTFLSGVTFRTADTTTLRVQDIDGEPFGELTGINVLPGDCVSFQVTGLPEAVPVGTPCDVEVKALDNWQNVATRYSGTITFTSNDPSCSLPSDYTFVSTDCGVRSFVDSVTFRSTGQRYLRVTDTSNPELIGEQSGILVTDDTVPEPVGDLQAILIDGRRVQLDWTPSVSEDAALYNIYFDSGTGTIEYSNPVGTVNHPGTSWISGPLVAGATYKFGVRTEDVSGYEESNTNVVVSVKVSESPGPTDVRAVIKVPQAGKKISGNRVTVVAELIQGTPSECADVLFQYNAGSGWSNLQSANPNHPNPDPTFPYFVHWDISDPASFPDGNYMLRAIACCTSGISDSSPASITVTIDRSDPDIQEEMDRGTLTRIERIDNRKDNTIQAGDQTEDNFIIVEIPCSSLADEKVKLTLVVNPKEVPDPGQNLNQTGNCIRVELSNGQAELLASKQATINIPYHDNDKDGYVDGRGIPQKTLCMFWYDERTSKWRKINTTDTDFDSKTCSVRRGHLGLFSIFGSPPDNYSEIRIYPNPYKPGGSHRVVKIEGLTAHTRMRICTISGRLVLEETEINLGETQWDGTNQHGQEVASGVYLCVFTNELGDRTVRKICIIR